MKNKTAVLLLTIIIGLVSSSLFAQSFLDEFESYDEDTWLKAEKGELSQGEGIISLKNCYIYGGDETWSNYEMEFRGRSPESASDVFIFASFRYQSDTTRYVIGLRGGNHNDLFLARYKDHFLNDSILSIVPLEFTPQKNTWYTITVKLIDGTIEAYLGDEENPRIKIEDYGYGIASGKVALGSDIGDAEYEYVKIGPVSGNYKPTDNARKYNFQHPTHETVEGWTPVNGALYLESVGYGFDARLMERDRGISSDQLFDTIVGTQGEGLYSFFMDLPNGDYVIMLSMGDPKYPSCNRVFFQDEPAVAFDYQTDPGQAYKYIRGITITNGQLKIIFEQLDDAVGVSINWLAIDARADAGEAVWDRYYQIVEDPAIAKEAQRVIERAAYTPFEVTEIYESRKEYSLNGDWLFMPEYEMGVENPWAIATDDNGWHVLKVPTFWSKHIVWTYKDTEQGRGSANWREIDAARCESYTFDYDKAKKGYYRHKLIMPDGITEGKSVKVIFNAIGKSSEVWINGNPVAAHEGMFAPVEANLTPHIQVGENILVVRAGDSVSNEGGHQHLLYGDNRGIWQDVKLVISDQLLIEDTFFKPGLNNFDMDVTVKNISDGTINYSVAAQIRNFSDNSLVYDNLSSSRQAGKSIAAAGVEKFSLTSDDARHAPFENWSPEIPNLYKADVFVYTYNSDPAVNISSAGDNAIMINFQELTDSVPAGWQAVDGSLYDAANGCGWSITGVTGTERNVHSQQQYDTVLFPPAESAPVFRYDLENGDYLITICLGDPQEASLAEAYLGADTADYDSLIVKDFKASGEFAIALKSVSITEGKFELTIPRLSAEGRGTSITWLTIENRSDITAAKWELGKNHFNILDNVSYNVGFKTFHVDGDNFMMNDKPYKYRGATLSPNLLKPNDKALANKFMKMLHDNNIHANKNHGAPYNETWLNAADEHGVGVTFNGFWVWMMFGGYLENIPEDHLISAWSNEWLAVVNKHKNHPSINIWTLNNEMKLWFENSIESWEIISEAVSNTRIVDPTRPIIVSTAYCRKYLNNVGGLHPGIDDGDIDDQHTFYNWYNPQNLFDLRDGTTYTYMRTPGRPFFSQEFSMGYPDADGGHAVKHYIYYHMTPQAHVGKWAYEDRNPKYWLNRHAMMAKESSEAIRNAYRDTSAGMLAFALGSWFQNLYDAETISPYPTLYSYADSLEPVMASVELMGRHFYAGSSHTVDSFIVNDSPLYETLSNITVDWEIQENGVSLHSGVKSYSEAVPYYENLKESLTFSLPSVLPQEKVKGDLVLKINANGRPISTNKYPITVCNEDYVNSAAGLRVGYFTQDDKLSPILSSMGLDIVVLSDLSSLSTDDYDVLIVDNLSSVPADYSKVKDFAWSGGKVLLSLNKDYVSEILEDEITGSTLETKEIVTPCAYEKSIFDGIEPDDLAWFTGTEDIGLSPRSAVIPIACERAYNVNSDNVILLAESTRIHGYRETGYTENYHGDMTYDTLHGYPLVEVPKGMGTIIVSSMYFHTEEDPVAHRLLANTLNYLYEKELYPYVEPTPVPTPTPEPTPAPDTPITGNLLVNGSFEESTLWDIGTAEYSEVTASEGSRSLMVQETDERVLYPVAVEVGKTYRLSYSVHSDGLINQLIWVDTSDIYDADCQTVIRDPQSGWQHYQGDFTAIGTGFNIRIRTDSSYEGTCYVDNFVMVELGYDSSPTPTPTPTAEPTPTPTPVVDPTPTSTPTAEPTSTPVTIPDTPVTGNLLVNGSFEEDGVWDISTAQYSEVTASDRSRSLMVQTADVRVLYAVSLEVGKSYRFSYSIHSDGLTSQRLWVDTSDTYDDVCQQVIDEPQFGWQHYQGDFTATNTGFNIRVRTSSVYEGTCYVDDFVLVELGYATPTPVPTPVPVIPSIGQIISLKAVNGKYVSAAGDGNVLIADADQADSYEKFEIIDGGDGYIGLKCIGNGLLVCAEKGGALPLVANRSRLGSWEKFMLEYADTGKVTLRAVINYNLVCAEDAGSDPLIANRDSAGSWEQFYWEIK